MRSTFSRLTRIARRVRPRIGLSTVWGKRSGGSEQGPDWYDRVYDSLGTYREPYQRSRYYFLWAVIADRLRRSGIRRVLEIGCGTGQLAALLADQGMERYTGLDFSATAVSIARAMVPTADFRVGDARFSDVYEDAEHDAIICTEVLEHIEADLLVVSRFPSGSRCLCSVPNFEYESHVRHFADDATVADRYARFFNEMDVMTLKSPHATGEELFLLDGVRNNFAVSV